MLKAGVLLLGLFLIPFLTASSQAEQESLSDELESEYFSMLDGWAQRQGPINEVQDTVGETCGKLVMLSASSSERMAFVSTQREEFDFRVDVCIKMTVNRVHPQPEFENKAIVEMICNNNQVVLFKKLCRRSGLR